MTIRITAYNSIQATTFNQIQPEINISAPTREGKFAAIQQKATNCHKFTKQRIRRYHHAAITDFLA